MAASSFATRKGNGYLTPNSRPFGGSVLVEIGALAHARDHFAEERGNAIVDAVADALLRIRCPHLQ